MKCFRFALVAGVAALTFSVGTAQASTIFLSTTSTNPALTNPSVTINTNSSTTLYAFWAPSTEQTGTDGYGYPIISPEQLSGWSHDIVDDNAILSRTTYSFLNPTTGGSPRWGATNTGTSSGTFLTSGANAVKVGGSNLGFFTVAGQGYFNVGGQDVWRLATLTVASGGSTGTSNLKFDVGPSGISFQNAPTARTIHFGFGDAGVSSSSFGSVTTLADASITVVPEPGTLALLGMGVVGLVAVARRRRAA